MDSNKEEQSKNNNNNNGDIEISEKLRLEEEALKKAQRAKKMSNLKSGLCMSFGAFFVVSGAIAIVFWPGIFEAQLQENMIVKEGSQSFEMWRETPLPMYLEFHLWNITNTEDILARNATKIRVEELGPYVFRELQIKTNITFNDNGTVTFRNQRFWYFEPDLSNGSLSDMIVNVNPVIVTASYISRHNSAFTNLGLDIIFRLFHGNIFMTANASAWMFDGIEDPLIDAAELLPDVIDMPFDKFGWFYGRNGSTEFDGVFLMNTGAQDFSQLGELEKWNYSNRTIYPGECGEVKGSTGELWAPEKGQPEIHLFASDICAYLTLSKNETVEIQGIEGVSYAANGSLFDNGWNYPETACYCDEVRDNDCLRSGALNSSACRLGAPAFVTLPHMLNTDPYYPAMIEGQDPKEEYRFRMVLEMFTGIPLLVAAQLQINLLVRNVPGLSINNILPEADTLVPMFWFKQEVRLTDEYASLAKFALFMRFGIPYIMYALTSLGVLLLGGGIFILVRRLMRSPDTAPLVPQEEETSND